MLFVNFAWNKLILHFLPMFAVSKFGIKPRNFLRLLFYIVNYVVFRYRWWFSKKPIKLVLPLTKEALTLCLLIYQNTYYYIIAKCIMNSDIFQRRWASFDSPVLSEFKWRHFSACCKFDFGAIFTTEDLTCTLLTYCVKIHIL